MNVRFLEPYKFGNNIHILYSIFLTVFLTSAAALQDFLLAKGRLPVTSTFDSLLIGTLQHYLWDLNLYPDEKPCGVFGPNTRRSLKIFLMRQRFYRYSVHRVNADS